MAKKKVVQKTEIPITPEKENSQFKRKARIGINPITIEQGQTRFLQINSEKPEVFHKKDGDEVDYVLATDMETGEDGHFWLAGSLRHALTDMAKSRKSLVDLKIEVKALGKKSIEMMIDGKMKATMVNQFDLYELN